MIHTRVHTILGKINQKMIDALSKNISSRVQAIVNNLATLINYPRKKSRDQQLS